MTLDETDFINSLMEFTKAVEDVLADMNKRIEILEAQKDANKTH